MTTGENAHMLVKALHTKRRVPRMRIVRICELSSITTKDPQYEGAQSTTLDYSGVATYGVRRPRIQGDLSPPPCSPSSRLACPRAAGCLASFGPRMVSDALYRVNHRDETSISYLS